MYLYNRSFRLVSSLQQLILYLLHLYYRSFRLVSSLQQLILYLLHLYYRSFRLVSSFQSANYLFIAFILQILSVGSLSSSVQSANSLFRPTRITTLKIPTEHLSHTNGTFCVRFCLNKNNVCGEWRCYESFLI